MLIYALPKHTPIKQTPDLFPQSRWCCVKGSKSDLNEADGRPTGNHQQRANNRYRTTNTLRKPAKRSDQISLKN